MGLSAFDRHQWLMKDAIKYYRAKLPPEQQTVKTDFDVLKEQYRCAACAKFYGQAWRLLLYMTCKCCCDLATAVHMLLNTLYVAPQLLSEVYNKMLATPIAHCNVLVFYWLSRQVSSFQKAISHLQSVTSIHTHLGAALSYTYTNLSLAYRLAISGHTPQVE